MGGGHLLLARAHLGRLSGSTHTTSSVSITRCWPHATVQSPDSTHSCWLQGFCLLSGWSVRTSLKRPEVVTSHVHFIPLDACVSVAGQDVLRSFAETHRCFRLLAFRMHGRIKKSTLPVPCHATPIPPSLSLAYAPYGADTGLPIPSQLQGIACLGTLPYPIVCMYVCLGRWV